MSDTPPKVTELFIGLGTAAAFTIIYGLLFKDGLKNINAVEWSCLGAIGVMLFTIFMSYKFLERHREKHPSKGTVQKLGLDD